MSGENLAAAFAAMEPRYHKMSVGERFRFWCMTLIGLPYLWGQENPITGTDCSGSVCFPLLMMGYRIRVTADVLFRELFTSEETPGYDRHAIEAVFCTATTDQTHGDRTVSKGTAIHVMPIVGEGVVVNAAYPEVQIERLEAATATRFNQEIWIRRLSLAKARKLSDAGSHAWGVDEAIREMQG